MLKEKEMLTLIVTFFAGLGAGLGTGFAGMSAASIISPILITFLGVDPYTAVGIALASDVLASAVSAYTYGKNKNLDIRNGLLMMICVLTFTVAGSFISHKTPGDVLTTGTTVAVFILGLKFIIKPVKTEKETRRDISRKKRIAQSILCGMAVGLICGFMGAGGGMMMLFVLTTALGYDLKTAVGTSVFIMTFTAFTGAFSHFMIGELPDVTICVLCIIFTFIWARIAAVIANRVSNKTLNRATGVVLVTLGVVVFGFNFLAG